MPDWKVVFKNPQLRRLWWRGIPTKLRASMWEKAVGNPLALSKGKVLNHYSHPTYTHNLRPLPYLPRQSEASVILWRFSSRYSRST